MDAEKQSEDLRHWALIRSPVGGAWSGRARYAAAMYFYQCGAMDAATLEVYRICSRLDGEDPVDVMRRWQVGASWIARLLDEDNSPLTP